MQLESLQQNMLIVTSHNVIPNEGLFREESQRQMRIESPL